MALTRIEGGSPSCPKKEAEKCETRSFDDIYFRTFRCPAFPAAVLSFWGLPETILNHESNDKANQLNKLYMI